MEKEKAKKTKSAHTPALAKKAAVRKPRTAKAKVAPPEVLAVSEIEKPVIATAEPEEILEIGEGYKIQKYYEATGKRKSAVARVRLFTSGENEFIVNGKPSLQYFQSLELQQIAESSLIKMKCSDKFRTVVLVRGGGIHAQAEAVRHGAARALIKFNQDFRKRLRRVGYITRDPRARERKKFGLKRARRAPQWGKR